jgi:hypothetical protein
MKELSLQMNIFSPGLLHVLITDPRQAKRFRVSDYNGVEWH